MTDPRIVVLRELVEQLQYGVLQRNRLWEDYWREGRRMVTVPAPIELTVHEKIVLEKALEEPMKQNPLIRPFESFPNLAPKMYQRSVQETPEYQAAAKVRNAELSAKIDALHLRSTSPMAGFINDVAVRAWVLIVRDCIARLRAARAKESTNRNLSTLLAVVVKVQKDLETLVGDDWQHDDAAVESQVTRDDRSL